MNQIKKFQRRAGITPDGIIGPQTLRAMQEHFNIETINRLAHFLGQLAHETANFTRGRESLNYSVKGLKSTFSYYRRNPNLAELHGRKPGQRADQVAIANTVYADHNRNVGYKLGNTQPGDGWRFIGRGAIQLTGRANYERFFKWAELPLTTSTKRLEDDLYWKTALYFFDVHDIWELCDSGTHEGAVRKVTKKINGGYNGLQHRMNLTEMYKRMLL